MRLGAISSSAQTANWQACRGAVVSCVGVHSSAGGEHDHDDEELELGVKAQSQPRSPLARTRLHYCGTIVSWPSAFQLPRRHSIMNRPTCQPSPSRILPRPIAQIVLRFQNPQHTWNTCDGYSFIAATGGSNRRGLSVEGLLKQVGSTFLL